MSQLKTYLENALTEKAKLSPETIEFPEKIFGIAGIKIPDEYKTLPIQYDSTLGGFVRTDVDLQYYITDTTSYYYVDLTFDYVYLSLDGKLKIKGRFQKSTSGECVTEGSYKKATMYFGIKDAFGNSYYKTVDWCKDASPDISTFDYEWDMTEAGWSLKETLLSFGSLGSYNSHFSMMFTNANTNMLESFQYNKKTDYDRIYLDYSRTYYIDIIYTATYYNSITPSHSSPYIAIKYKTNYSGAIMCKWYVTSNGTNCYFYSKFNGRGSAYDRYITSERPVCCMSQLSEYVDWENGVSNGNYYRPDFTATTEYGFADVYQYIKSTIRNNKLIFLDADNDYANVSASVQVPAREFAAETHFQLLFADYNVTYFPNTLYGYKTDDSTTYYVKTIGYASSDGTALTWNYELDSQKAATQKVRTAGTYAFYNYGSEAGQPYNWTQHIHVTNIGQLINTNYVGTVTYISASPNPAPLTYAELVERGVFDDTPTPPTPPEPGEGISCFVKYPLSIIDPEGTITDAEDWFDNNWMSIYARQPYDYNGDYPVGTEKCNVQLSKDSSRASEATMDENYLYYPAYIYISKETKTETGWNYNSTSYYSNQEPYITSEILTEFDRLLSLSDMRPESVWINEHSYYPSNINDNVIPGTFDLGNMIDGAPLEVARRTYYDRMDELVNVLLAGEDMTLYHCPPLSAIKEYNQTHNNENEE